MPLTPRYTWEEDTSSLALELHLPGTALCSTDIYVSDLVVKVNAGRYVLLLDLEDTVDDASAIVKSIPASNSLRISLQKQSPRLWEHLQYQGTKKELRERRDASMDRKRESETALSAKRKEKKHDEEKQTLRAQMAVDDNNRQILTDLKAEEKEREERSLYESFRELQVEKQQQRQRNTTPPKSTSSNQYDHLYADKISSDSLSPSRSRKRPTKKVTFAALPHELDGVSSQPETSNQREKEEDIIELTADGSFDIATAAIPRAAQLDMDTFDELRLAEPLSPIEKTRAEAIRQEEEEGQSMTQEAVIELPPPRESLRSEIRFTPRVFPTPSRESKAAEEEDWLLKNRKHINKHQGLNRAEAYDISETDPMWLKAKGDDFFYAKDFRSATNAYAESISVAPSDNTDLMATCLSNRAACLLMLEEFEECIVDCSKALSYLPDTRGEDAGASVLKHYRLKLKLFVRRGTAYCRVGKYSEAKADYGVAYSMDNKNPQLHDDFMELMVMEKAHALKEEGDTLLKEHHDRDQAIQKYSEALRLNPLSIACLSNRAACHLMRHAAKECVDDCSRALQLLQQDTSAAKGGELDCGLAFFSIGPVTGSPQRRAWVVKTLVRRGAAYLSTGDYANAEADYGASVELDPANEALKRDLARVQREREESSQNDCTAVSTPTSTRTPITSV